MTIEIKKLQLEILQQKLEEIKKENYIDKDELSEIEIERQQLRKQKLDSDNLQEIQKIDEQIRIKRDKIGKLKKIIEARTSIIIGMENLI